MFPASFGYVAARSVEEALELMVKHGEDGKLLAGGHSLIPAMKLRLQSPRTLIDLGTVAGAARCAPGGCRARHGRADGPCRCRFIRARAQTFAGTGRGPRR